MPRIPKPWFRKRRRRFVQLDYGPACKAGADLLFDLIGHACERQNVVVTTNLPFEHWTELFGYARLTGAAPDRLNQRSVILEFSGEGYRRQNARRRRRKRG